MGLSICQSIIEAPGGSLRATGNVPHGASFQFTVPREERWMILFGRSSPECSRSFRLDGAGCLADSGEWTRLCPNRVTLGHGGMSALSPFYPHVWTAPSWQGLSSRMQIGRCSHVFGLLRGSHDRVPRFNSGRGLQYLAPTPPPAKSTFSPQARGNPPKIEPLPTPPVWRPARTPAHCVSAKTGRRSRSSCAAAAKEKAQFGLR